MIDKKININKIMYYIITVIVLVSFCTTIFADVIPTEELTMVEIVLTGSSTENNEAILKRVEILENTLFGHKGKGSLKDRATDIIDYVTSNEKRPSLLLLINTMEWTLKNKVVRGNLLERLNQLEKDVYGEVKSGSVMNRIQNLSKLTLPAEALPADKVILPAGREITIRILEKIDTGKLVSGQLIKYEIEKNIKVDNYLTIPAGTTGTLQVRDLEKAGNFGKDASLKLIVNDIMSMDGTMVPANFSLEEEKKYSREIAIGISFLGTMIMSHPAGLVAGYFYKGKDIVIPVGTLMEIEVSKDVELHGLKLE